MGQAVWMDPAMGYLGGRVRLGCPGNGWMQVWSKRPPGRVVNWAKAEALGWVPWALVASVRFTPSRAEHAPRRPPSTPPPRAAIARRCPSVGQG